MVYRSLIFAFVLLFRSGVGSLLHAQPYERIVRDTMATAPETLSIENWAGSITVSTWDRDLVEYNVRIVSGQSRDIIEQTTIDAEHFNQRLSLVSNVEQIEPPWAFGPDLYGYGVTYPEVHSSVQVPTSVAVTIEDQESAVQVSGLAASLQVDTDEGSVTVRDHQGTARLDTHEGTLTLADVTGDLKVDTHEGTLDAQGLRGRLMLDTHEGRAEVGVDSLATTTIDTHEGEVQLTVPSDAGFELSAELGEDATLQSGFSIDALRDEEGHYQGSVQGGTAASVGVAGRGDSPTTAMRRERPGVRGDVKKDPSPCEPVRRFVEAGASIA